MHDVPPVKRLIKSHQQQSQKHNQQFWLLSFLYLKEYFLFPLKKISGFLREHKGLHCLIKMKTHHVEKTDY